MPAILSTGLVPFPLNGVLILWYKEQRMESSARSRRSEIGSDIAIIVVTVANLIFIAFFHEYIAWYTIRPDGSVIRLSMLTDDYFIWLPIPVTASIVAIVAYTLMIIYDRYWFRTIAQIIVISIGIAVVGSLLYIFPFDFSVIPNATAVEVVPIMVTGFLILMAVIYGVSVLVLSARLVRSYAVKSEAS